MLTKKNIKNKRNVSGSRRSKRQHHSIHLRIAKQVVFILLIFVFIALSVQTATKILASPLGPVTNLHYAANGNFSGSTYLPGAAGFNLADVSSISQVNQLPSGVKALVYLGLCNGADANFIAKVQPFVANAQVFGYYVKDEPDPTGQYSALCTAANLKAESDWIHAHDPGKKTFIIIMNMSSSNNPSYANTYNPSNSGIDLYGVDAYACRSEFSGCDYTLINRNVNAVEAAGIPAANVVPVYQAFGGGAWIDDTGGTYLMPTVAQATQIFNTWASLIPSPVFDYVYSWGTQSGDTALISSSALQQIFLTHNTPSTSPSPPPSGGSTPPTPPATSPVNSSTPASKATNSNKSLAKASSGSNTTSTVPSPELASQANTPTLVSGNQTAAKAQTTKPLTLLASIGVGLLVIVGGIWIGNRIFKRALR